MRGIAAPTHRLLTAVATALAVGILMQTWAHADDSAPRRASPRPGLTFTNATMASGLGGNQVKGVFVVDDSVYAATNGGLSISGDGGVTFTNRPLFDGAFNVSGNGVSAVDDTVYVASSSGLFVSGNGGATLVRRSFVPNGLANDQVYGVSAVDDTVYSATQGGLSISTDGGVSFANRTTSNSTIGDNWTQGLYAVDDSVYVATLSSGLSISSNGGATFTNYTTANALGDNNVLGVYAAGMTVYAATNGGLSISTNGGLSFSNRTFAQGLGSNFVRGVYAVGSTVYAATAPAYGKPGGLSVSTDGGASFTNYTTADGLANNTVFGVYVAGGVIYAATNGGLSMAAVPVPPGPPPPPVPSEAPLDVVAIPGDASAAVRWSAPVDSGSFPVTSYQVQASPSGVSCLAPAPALTCSVGGLRNGVSYVFAVRALSGAGWGAWSLPSGAVTPQAAVIVITGARLDRRTVAVTGTTSGLTGAVVVPWLRFAGEQKAEAWLPRPIQPDGTFSWTRRTARQVQVYFTQGTARSNAISLPAAPARSPR